MQIDTPLILRLNRPHNNSGSEIMNCTAGAVARVYDQRLSWGGRVLVPDMVWNAGLL